MSTPTKTITLLISAIMSHARKRIRLTEPTAEFDHLPTSVSKSEKAPNFINTALVTFNQKGDSEKQMAPLASKPSKPTSPSGQYLPADATNYARLIQMSELDQGRDWTPVDGDGAESGWEDEKIIFNPTEQPTGLADFPKRRFLSDAAVFALLKLKGLTASAKGKFAVADLNCKGKILRDRVPRGFPAATEDGKVINLNGISLRGDLQLNEYSSFQSWSVVNIEPNHISIYISGSLSDYQGRVRQVKATKSQREAEEDFQYSLKKRKERAITELSEIRIRYASKFQDADPASRSGAASEKTISIPEEGDNFVSESKPWLSDILQRPLANQNMSQQLERKSNPSPHGQSSIMGPLTGNLIELSPTPDSLSNDYICRRGTPRTLHSLSLNQSFDPDANLTYHSSQSSFEVKNRMNGPLPFNDLYDDDNKHQERYLRRKNPKKQRGDTAQRPAPSTESPTLNHPLAKSPALKRALIENMEPLNTANRHGTSDRDEIEKALGKLKKKLTLEQINLLNDMEEKSLTNMLNTAKKSAIPHKLITNPPDKPEWFHHRTVHWIAKNYGQEMQPAEFLDVMGKEFGLYPADPE